jgi:hypothetical protein
MAGVAWYIILITEEISKAVMKIREELRKE